MKRNRRVVVVGAALLAGGCYEGVDVGADIASTRDSQFNTVQMQGVQLQGIQLQGIQLQGIQLQGIQLQGIQLQGIQLQGIQLQGIQLQGSSLQGFELVNGQPILRGGDDFIGSEWNLRVQLKDAQGQPKTEDFVLRIDDIAPDGFYDDVMLYDVVYRSKLGGEWHPLCSDDAGNPVPSIPLQHYWDEKTGNRIDDPKVVSFACTNAVLGKCVEWGYRPWATEKRCDPWFIDKKKKGCKQVSLRDYHQACTRMARADYCGDGTPWTTPGTAIDIYDHLSPQIEEPETNWFIEAEWGPDGAYCLNDIRQQGWKAEGKYPSCNNGKAKKLWDCGSLNDHRALTVSSFNKKKKQFDKPWNFNEFWQWK